MPRVTTRRNQSHRHLAPHWMEKPGTKWFNIFWKGTPRDVRDFCELHQLFPTLHLYGTKWWWRVVWIGDAESALITAQEEGFEAAAVLDCYGTILLLLREA